MAAHLFDLIREINRTNSGTELSGGATLTDALARRDVLALRRSVYADLAAAASVRQDRYSKSEVKFVSAVDVASLQRQADALAKEYRELDSAIQARNWEVELLESR